MIRMNAGKALFDVGDRIKRALHWYVTFVQKIVIAFCLFFLYMIGFGIMAIFARITGYKPASSRKTGDGFWIKAEGYDDSLADCVRES
jgi:hypothetical protein